MSVNVLIVGLSVLFHTFAAFLAFRLIKITGHKIAGCLEIRNKEAAREDVRTGVPVNVCKSIELDPKAGCSERRERAPDCACGQVR